MAISNGKSKLQVLIVEDNTDDVYLIVEWLKKEWHVVWHRVENEPALLLALDDPWDVIICDVRLPTLSAERVLSVTTEYLALRRWSLIPIIIVSGIVDENEAIAYLKKGARDFISKDKMQRLALAIKRELRHGGELLASRLKIEEAYDAVIEAWGKAMELRDHYTSGHTDRVTTLSLRLAIEMNIPRKDFINLNRGAALHDIGKMGIPDAVLLKQDELTPEEREIMKMHPTLGYEMLKNIPFLKDAVDVPYCHHERWNGTGYPRGLAGTDIPLLARIFAVVDVYDALTSDRPYRKSWEKSQTIAFIIEERNISFDPEVVDAFINMIGRG
jgi:response regulator RpfG family c-di-GMP phosphodiesterase